MEKIIGRGNGFVAVEIPFTPRAKRVLELSLEEARQLGMLFIKASCEMLSLSRCLNFHFLFSLIHARKHSRRNCWSRSLWYPFGLLMLLIRYSNKNLLEECLYSPVFCSPGKEFHFPITWLLPRLCFFLESSRKLPVSIFFDETFCLKYIVQIVDYQIQI